MVAARLAERLLGLFSTVILARLLAPSDFGLVAMAMVFVAAADVLGAFGLDWALVRQPAIEERHLNTSWTIRTALGALSLVMLVALAIPIARFYDEPRIAGMVVVLGLSLLIGAMENPGVVMYRREMNFTKEFQIRTIAKLTGALVAIGMAVLFRSYWALLLGTLAGRSAATLASYLMHPHRPRATLSARRDLLGFSLWLWISNLLSFLRVRGVQLILGRMVGSRDLGLFAISLELSELASTELAAPVNRALFSAYATRGSDPAAVGRVYLEAAPVIWLLTLPAVIGIYLAAPQLVTMLLGPQWLDAIPLIRILAIGGAFSLISKGTIQVYWAINRARLETFVEAFWVTCLLTMVVVLTRRFGVEGAAIAVLVTSLLLVPVNLVLLQRFAGVPVRQIAARSWRILLACGAMYLVVSAVAADWTPAGTLGALTQFVAMAGLGGIVYGTVLFGSWQLLGRPAGPESAILRIAKERLGRLQRR